MFCQAAGWKPATDNQIVFNVGVYYLLRGLCKIGTPQGFEKEALTEIDRTGPAGELAHLGEDRGAESAQVRRQPHAAGLGRGHASTVRVTTRTCSATGGADRSADRPS